MKNCSNKALSADHRFLTHHQLDKDYASLLSWRLDQHSMSLGHQAARKINVLNDIIRTNYGNI